MAFVLPSQGHARGPQSGPPPTFPSRGQQPDRLFSVEFMSTDLPDVGLLRSGIVRRLYKAFAARIAENDRAIAAAGFNQHGYEHQRRVARGVWELGQRIPEIHGDNTMLQAATVGTTVHDVGYDFPEAWSHTSITQFGKEAHAAHAENGAKVFHQTFPQLHDESMPDLRLHDWTEQHLAVAADAIRYHSNDSRVSSQSILSNEQIHPASLLSRVVDKLDMQNRVNPDHLEAISIAATARNVRAVQRWTGDRSRICLIGEHSSKKRFRNEPLPKVREKVAACDSYQEHRLGPAAIAEQKMWYGSDGSLHVRYTAYPQRVSDLLRTTYGVDDHERDFLKAYGGKSLPEAALVMEALRARFGTVHSPDSAPLNVTIYYPGHEEERHFLFDSSGLQEKEVVKTSASAS